MDSEVVAALQKNYARDPRCQASSSSAVMGRAYACGGGHEKGW
jgi:hypothetical protein